MPVGVYPTYTFKVLWDDIASYRAVVLSDGASYYWRLDEASGNVTDIVGGKVGTATHQGSGSFTYSQAGALSGDTDTAILCAVPNQGTDSAYFLLSPSITLSLPLTFEAWVKPTNNRGDQALFARLGNENFGLGTTGRLYFNATGADVFGSNSQYTLNAWNHVVATIDAAGSCWFYVNGVPNPGGAVALGVFTFHLQSLNANTSTAGTAGTLDDLAVYPTVLTAAQVLAHYQAGTKTGVAGYDAVAVRSNPAVSIKRGMDQVRVLAPPRIGSFSGQLDNTTGYFSAGAQSASPLLAYLYPGHVVTAVATYGGTDYPLFYGLLDSLPQIPDINMQSVGFPAQGVMSLLQPPQSDVPLQNPPISTPLYASIRTDQAIGYILDAAGFPSAQRVLDVGQTTFQWFWVSGQTAFQALIDVLVAEGPGARLYEDASGNIVFESRVYRYNTSRSQNSQATFRTSGAAPWMTLPFSWDDGIKNVVNVATTIQKVRSAKTTSVVWTYGNTITLLPSQTFTVEATNGDPFQAAITPVSATDFTVSVGTITAVSLDRTSGQSCTVSLTAGVLGATVTGLQLRANLVTVDSTSQLTSTVDTTTSQARHKKRIYPYAVRPEIDPVTLQNLVNAVCFWYQYPRPQILTLTVEANADAANMVQALARQVSDRVTVIEPKTGINEDYWVERIEHKIDSNGQHHVATFGMESASAAGTFWQVGISTVGVSSVLGF